VELVDLKLNGKPLESRRVEMKSAAGVLADHYYIALLPSLGANGITVTATLRDIFTCKQMTKEFHLGPI
jgi:hypothetical protein